MATQRPLQKGFPLDEFLRQYNEAGRTNVPGGHVQVRPFRSRKHATAELWMPDAADATACTRGRTVVAKHYDDGARKQLQLEHAVLSRAGSAGLLVPRVLHVLDNFLVLERIHGSTLIDVINDDTIDLLEKEAIIQGLGEWLAKFHDTFSTDALARRRGDANLRNFVLAERGHVFGFDFEEASTGDPLDDIHETLDSLLISDPGVFSSDLDGIGWKFGLGGKLLSAYIRRAGALGNRVVIDPDAFVARQVHVMSGLAAIRGRGADLAAIEAGLSVSLDLMLARIEPPARRVAR